MTPPVCEFPFTEIEPENKVSRDNQSREGVRGDFYRTDNALTIANAIMYGGFTVITPRRNERESTSRATGYETLILT